MVDIVIYFIICLSKRYLLERQMAILIIHYILSRLTRSRTSLISLTFSKVSKQNETLEVTDLEGNRNFAYEVYLLIEILIVLIFPLLVGNS